MAAGSPGLFQLLAHNLSQGDSRPACRFLQPSGEFLAKTNRDRVTPMAKLYQAGPLLAKLNLMPIAKPVSGSGPAEFYPKKPDCSLPLATS
jgi:hypothetical protein